ncbi:ParB/RepB/Spo0J family partition protein [Bifidobacterium sp. ESL0763]|uniref:ParB/RepB/Spo0J family partition protein n=1 Tax=Bifidobacterium sp. ESL0763 TaxID=2983227 RepID=UPI0023F9861E|nr:ParB/RepB/Spo0J family partition protein [Bifidobacterium sp. ESL0763]MDF7663149.1 ParB/RepB/Spo0J family partition protein [Bifidobacterium sp. ESL0763]
MASKSRLGKGLGALFPALPEDPKAAKSAEKAEENKPETKQKTTAKGNVLRETSKTGKTSKSDEAKSATKKTTVKSNVSRETSKVTESKKQGAKGNVSRETSHGKGKKRKSMPSFEGIAGPSDVFFGGALDNSSAKHSAEQSKRSGNKVTVTRSASDAGLAANDQGLKSVQGGYLTELHLDQIGPNVHQPRSIFDEDELSELAASLKEVGVLQPVVVRKRPKNQKLEPSALTIVGKNVQQKQQGFDSEYELIMGERRWRAAHLAGLETIPAIVKTTADDEMLRDALLENLHRVALNPLEEAAAYQQMMDDFGLTQEQLSHSVSKSRPQIANVLRLLNLPPSVQKKVAAGVLSAGHARALLGLSSPEEMDKLANRIIAEGLSVRSTEEIVAMKSMEDGEKGQRKDRKKSNPWSESPIQRNLENRFDTKVAIKGNKKHGRIEIVFSSPEDMDRILGLLMPGKGDKKESGWV